MIKFDAKVLFSLILTIATILIVAPLISPLWKQVVFVIFALYTLPFLNLRNQFRSMVYDDDSWKINVKPVFVKEIKVLFSNSSLENTEQLKIANNYRLYLLIYSILFGLLTLG